MPAPRTAFAVSARGTARPAEAVGTITSADGQSDHATIALARAGETVFTRRWARRRRSRDGP